MQLVLHTLAPAFGVRCGNPFALKAEVLLAMAGLDYEKNYVQPRFGPRQKMPVLHHGEVVVPDTRNIQVYLEKTFRADFDGHLGPQERAQVVALRRLGEEHLYWAQTHFRWEDHSAVVRETLFAEVPRLLRDFVFGKVKKNVDLQLWGHGFGRLPRAEKLERAREDLQALRVALGDRPFFFGSRPCSLDATVYPLVLNLLAPETPSPLAPELEGWRPYLARMEGVISGAIPLDRVRGSAA